MGSLHRSTSFDGSALVQIGAGVIESGLWTRLAAVSGSTVANDILYVGSVVTPANSQWGFHASFDGGASFERRIQGLDGNSVFSMAVDPFDPMGVMLGTMGGGVYRTTTGGLDWSPKNQGIQAMATLGVAGQVGNPRPFVDQLYGGIQWHPRAV